MKTELEEFILSKIADVEKSIAAREQAEKCFRRGTDAEWNQIARMHKSKRMTQGERIETADKEARIAQKLRRELELFQEVLAALRAGNK